ncbi:MAG TPA: class I SAM-dependent methyltransferase [Steroidobacteraceae bacterium]|nr:class I SAM-dependent methyltransferase [Steroidobacteraceae bacterium]
MHRQLSAPGCEALRQAQRIYDIPSLAAWRAAELQALRRCRFQAPVLEIGCGSGRFTALLLEHVDWGVDLNPREVALCSRRNGMYGRVAAMDARAMDFADGAFATVFANCVIEHIPDLPRLLAECRRVLRPGGALIATVPLEEMNRHLLLRSEWYARMRAAQLQHRHVLPESEWVAALSRAGFSNVRTTAYLPSRLCELWDRVDAPLCLGAGPATVGRAYRMALHLLPGPLRRVVNRQWERYFAPALASNPAESPCAMVIEAHAGGWALQPAVWACSSRGRPDFPPAASRPCWCWRTTLLRRVSTSARSMPAAAW